MTSSQLQEYARFGAQARLNAIEEERQAIFQVFPELGNGTAPSKPASSIASSTAAPAARTRSGMSPTQRKAVGERMKAYWAKRRAEKAGTDAPQAQTASEAPAAPKPTSNRKAMSPGRKAQAEKMRAYWAARRAEKRPASNGGQADTGAGSSGKSKGSRTAGRREARKK